MGFLFRAAVVIGTIYAISPLRDADEPLVPRAAQESLARGAQDVARQAVGAAATLCRDHAATCVQAAAALTPKAAPPPPPMAVVPPPTRRPAPRPESPH